MGGAQWEGISMDRSGRARGIDRVIEVLEFLRETRQPISVGDLARKIGAPRSTLYEIVNSLTAAGILETADAQGRVFFGRAVYFYADAYLASQPLVRNGRDEVIRLAETTGETAQLCMLLGNKYTVAHMQPGSNLFRISSETGILVPIPWTASGRVLLGGMTEEQIRALIPPEDYRLPDGRMIAFSDFMRDVRQTHDHGYAITSALADKFTCCLAAPILNEVGQPIATICFVVPIHTQQDRLTELTQMLVASGQSISRRLGSDMASLAPAGQRPVQ
jgi:DNA-binding IclR family transcriptional regulator